MIQRLAWNAYLARQMIGQKRLPFRPVHELERLQARRVRAMVKHAYGTVPFYRETMDRLHLKPSDFRSADDLGRLPIVEKQQLLEDPERFRSSAISSDDCLRLRTGGSTGIACTVDIDTAALFQNAAHGERERVLITDRLGHSYGYRETVIGSPTTTDRVVQEYCQSRGWFPSGLRMERQYLSLVDPPQQNLRRLNEFRPILLRSYGSYLDELFSHLERTGAELERPTVITYSSDALSPGVRGMIEQDFGIPVFAFYEAVEAFKIGFQCEHSTGVHQNLDLYPVRIVDEQDETAPDGVSGEVVVSNLVNRATVLLNYRLGDLATKDAAPCACGRTLPILSLPEGRNDEFLTFAGGRRVHPQAIRTVVLDEDAVWQFQAVQETLEDIRLSIVPDPKGDHAEMTRRLQRRLESALGPEVRIQIALVDSIPRREGASKFRVVLSRLTSTPETSRSIGNA